MFSVCLTTRLYSCYWYVLTGNVELVRKSRQLAVVLITLVSAAVCRLRVVDSQTLLALVVSLYRVAGTGHGRETGVHVQKGEPTVHCVPCPSHVIGCRVAPHQYRVTLLSLNTTAVPVTSSCYMEQYAVIA